MSRHSTVLIQVRAPSRAAYSLWRPFGAPGLRKLRLKARAFAALQRAKAKKATPRQKPSMGGVA